MRKPAVIAVLVVCLAGALPACAEAPKVETDKDKILYTLGYALSQNILAFSFTEAELALIQAGLGDAVMQRDPQVTLDEFGPQIDTYLQERVTGIMEKEKEQGDAFRAKMGEEAGAVTLESGLVYREIAAGDGPNPGPTETVKINYHGTLRDGTVFDSSREGDDPTPASFALNAVIGCFSEGLQRMKVGGESKLTCPPGIAYGDRGRPPKIGPGATLVFEIELLEIVPTATPAPVSP